MECHPVFFSDFFFPKILIETLLPLFGGPAPVLLGLARPGRSRSGAVGFLLGWS